MRKKRTEAQQVRQHEDYRTGDGKYALVNPCEVCGKSAGVSYYSHPLTDEWGFALILCKRCAVATDSATTPKEFERLAKPFEPK